MPIETPSSVVSAIEHCLKPITRLCIHFGLDYRQLSEMLKNAFITVAEDEFKIGTKSHNVSRIALLTGIHRKDVKRLLDQAPEKNPQRQQKLLANLLAQWLGMPELLNEDGEPKPIPRATQSDDIYSFNKLAESITNDLHPRALLDECINRGLVSLSEDDMVHLIVDSLIPADDIDEKAYFFSESIHDHIAAAEHNLIGGQPPFLDRFVWHEGLTESDIKVIAAAARKAAITALKQVNIQAIKHKQPINEGDTTPRFRMLFGTFFYSSRSKLTEAENASSTQN